MKKRFLIPLTASLFLGIIACNNKSADDKNKPAAEAADPNANISNQISFKADGQDITSSGYNIGRFVKNKKRGIRIMSNMYQVPQAINIDISSIAPGTYKFVSGKAAEKDSTGAYGSYFPNYAKDMNNNYFFETGEFIITAVDTVKGTVNGTFSGKATNIKKQSVTITDGKVINGKIEPLVYTY